MSIVTASKAKAQLHNLIDEVAESRVPLRIVGKHNSAVLVSQEDWEAIQETLYLCAIPGMRESIQQGLQTAVAECHTELEW
jgi:prevent-host-death family protein